MRELNVNTKMLICAFLEYTDGKMVKSVIVERIINADMNTVIHKIKQTYKDNDPVELTITDSERAKEEGFFHPYTKKIIIPCSCNSGITTIAGTKKHGLILYVGDVFTYTLNIKDIAYVLKKHFGNLDEYLDKADKYNWK